MKKIIVVFLILCLLLSSSITTVNATDQSSISNDDSELTLEEIQSFPKLKSLSTEYADAYQTTDDTITYVISANEVNFLDDSGQYRSIDNSIVSVNKSDLETALLSSTIRYKNAANKIQYYFGETSSNAPQVVIQNGDSSIEMIVCSPSSSSLSKANSIQTEKLCEEYRNAFSSENTIVYKNLFDENADVVYTVKGSSLKEDIIFYNKPLTNTISYELNIKNLNVSIVNEILTGKAEDTRKESYYSKKVCLFTDTITNAELFRIDNLYMVDSSGIVSDSIDFNLSPNPSKRDSYLLTLDLDEDFLENATYPIIVDPTVQGSSTVFDTYASSTNPTTNYYLNYYVRTGKDTPYGIRRTFVKFSIPSISINNPIISAKVYLKKYSSEGSINLNAVRVTSSWSTSSLTWNNSPSSTTKHMANVSHPAADNWYTIDVTKITSRWNVGLYSNYGLKIYDDVESNANVWATFYSSDYSTTSDGPKLVISVYTGSSLWTTYEYPYPGLSFTVKNELPSAYSSYLTTARGFWNNAGVGCSITESSSSRNRVIVDNTMENTGEYRPANYAGTEFSIAVNFDLVKSSGAEWNYTYIGTIVHELGHALSLGDLPNAYYCIMGYNRDRDVVYRPTASDIAGVNAQH